MKTLTITVPGPPLAKKRHRTVPMLQCNGCQKKMQGQYRECPHCGGSVRFLTNLSYSDSESVRYENLISYCSRQAMTTQQVEMFTGAIKVSMVFTFPIPISRACKKDCWSRASTGDPTFQKCSKTHLGDLHTQRPDLDNLNKSLDGLNGIVFADDCIIAEAVARKVWGSEGRAEIVVESL